MKTISEVLKEKYGEKIYRLSLESGCTCPNRDGSKGTGGCSFCSLNGSGDFAVPLEHETNSLNDLLDRQITKAKEIISRKTNAKRFIAYFQSYSNTYGDPAYLENLYTAVAERDDIVILSLGTRPDCINDEIIEMLIRVNRIKPVWVELGLQTMHEKSADMIGRGFSLYEFEQAYSRLKDAGIEVIIHVIMGFPWETRADMIETVKYVAGLEPKPDGIKMHMLQVLDGTRLGEEYKKNPFYVMSLNEYAELIRHCLKIIGDDIVVHRMTGDGPKKILIAPKWSADKKNVLNTMHRIINDNQEAEHARQNI